MTFSLSLTPALLLKLPNGDLSQQDGEKTLNGRMTKKNVELDRESIVSRDIFSSIYAVLSHPSILLRKISDVFNKAVFVGGT